MELLDLSPAKYLGKDKSVLVGWETGLGSFFFFVCTSLILQNTKRRLQCTLDKNTTSSAWSLNRLRSTFKTVLKPNETKELGLSFLPLCKCARLG